MYKITDFSLYGDSAGGNLVLSMLQYIDFDKEFFKPKAVVSAYPTGGFVSF